MNDRDRRRAIDRVRDVAGACSGLDVLILHGSRARGDATAHSDWDFGYLGSSDLDLLALMAAVVTALGDDRVDLVDLARESGQLRYRAAADGITVFERAPGRAERFRLDAISYWLDMAPIIRAEYEAALARLSP